MGFHAMQAEHEPFLKALDFPECVFARSAKHGDFIIEYAYSFHPTPPEPEETRQSVTRSIEGELCYIPLENDWYLDEHRVNVRLIQIKAEAKVAWRGADEKIWIASSWPKRPEKKTFAGTSVRVTPSRPLSLRPIYKWSIYGVLTVFFMV